MLPTRHWLVAGRRATVETLLLVVSGVALYVATATPVADRDKQRAGARYSARFDKAGDVSIGTILPLTVATSGDERQWNDSLSERSCVHPDDGNPHTAQGVLQFAQPLVYVLKNKHGLRLGTRR